MRCVCILVPSPAFAKCHCVLSVSLPRTSLHNNPELGRGGGVAGGQTAAQMSSTESATVSPCSTATVALDTLPSSHLIGCFSRQFLYIDCDGRCDKLSQQ